MALQITFMTLARLQELQGPKNSAMGWKTAGYLTEQSYLATFWTNGSILIFEMMVNVLVYDLQKTTAILDDLVDSGR